MENLPQPASWDCERCGKAIDLWDWGYRPKSRNANGVIVPPPAVCANCLDSQLPNGDAKGFFRYVQMRHLHIRALVGWPPGTMITWRTDLPDIRGRRRDGEPITITYPGALYAVRVDEWDYARPQFKIGWGPEQSPPLLVILGATVIGTPDPKSGELDHGSWVFLWSWEYPDRRETCQLEPPNAKLTNAEAARLNQARRAFYSWKETRERAGRFESSNDFEEAVFAAVTALKKRRQRVTQEAVGRYIITQRGRNRVASDSPSDPGRQFRDWCTAFKIDAGNLLLRAKSACDYEE